jgi:hypothetical protein
VPYATVRPVASGLIPNGMTTKHSGGWDTGTA